MHAVVLIINECQLHYQLLHVKLCHAVDQSPSNEETEAYKIFFLVKREQLKEIVVSELIS